MESGVKRGESCVTAFPADGLGGPDRGSPQGAPLHACLPGEQVENTAESSWNDLQNRNLNWASACLSREDITEQPPTGRAQEQPQGVLRMDGETEIKILECLFLGTQGPRIFGGRVKKLTVVGWYFNILRCPAALSYVSPGKRSRSAQMQALGY